MERIDGRGEEEGRGRGRERERDILILHSAEREREREDNELFTGTFLLRDSAQPEFIFSVSFRRYKRTLHARIEQVS